MGLEPTGLSFAGGKFYRVSETANKPKVRFGTSVVATTTGVAVAATTSVVVAA